MAARLPFETTLTVPTRHLPLLLPRLARAGLTVLDTGERMTTDDGLDAEATLVIADVATVELDDAVSMGVLP
jgi:hypothetical protein